MKTLVIDTAAHEGVLACVEDNDVRAIRRIGRLNDSDMIPAIEGVLSEAGWAPATVERIACSVGPGGFTSVRSGVVVANALADQLDIPIAGYHGSASMLCRCHGSSPLTMTSTVSSRAETRDDILWIHSTRKDQVFIRGGAWPEPTLVPLAQAVSAVIPGTPIVGDLLPEHSRALEQAGGLFPELQPLERVLPGFLRGFSYEKRPVLPWYGRGI